MFDILRNKDEDKDNTDSRKDKELKEGAINGEDKEDKVNKNPSLNFPRGILRVDPIQDKEPEDHSLLSKKLISAVKKHGIDNQEKAKEIYDNALGIVKILLGKVRLKENLDPYIDKIYNLLDDIFNQLVLGDSILGNIWTQKEDEYYLPYHIVNTLILSSIIGLSAGFNKSRLNHLGLSAIFYDVEMYSLREITGLPRKLTEAEYDLVKSHIYKSLKVVEKISSINEVVKETIGMHHERVNGKGYPLGLRSEEINPYAKIIGLMDTYDAITDSRPYREGMNAHKAVRFLIGFLKDYFDPDVMKVFINKLSIYPIGSIVKLDTKELARVISVQPGSPLRPVIAIIQDASGEPIKDTIIIDLSRQNFPSIQESI